MADRAARRVLAQFAEHTAQRPQTADPYSQLLSERVVLLGTPIDEASAGEVIARLILLEHAAPGQDIQLSINSPGGSVTAMSAVYDTMQSIGCDIRTVCLGRAASAAAVLLAAGTRGKRQALPHSRVLIHQPSAAEPARGRPSDLAVQAAEMQRQRSLVEDLLARHTGRPRRQIAADLERGTVLDAASATAYGIVDRLTGSRTHSLPQQGR